MICLIQLFIFRFRIANDNLSHSNGDWKNIVISPRESGQHVAAPRWNPEHQLSPSKQSFACQCHAIHGCFNFQSDMRIMNRFFSYPLPMGVWHLTIVFRVAQFSRKLVFECKLWILMLSYQLASPRPSIGFGGTRLTSPVFLPLSWRYWCKSEHYHISQTLPTLNLAAALHLQPPSKSRRQKLTMCGLLASGGCSIWSLKIKIADKIYFFSTAVGDAALVYPSGFLLGMAG